ncbi:SH3 domain-containing protein [Brasilonema sp. CT11]|nr:SH3 domain-containing protein [Brasilonema sp. CT11]
MIVNVLKYTLGILLAIAILAGGGFATALYVINRTTIIPPKPIYVNDSASVKGENPKAVPKGTKETSTVAVVKPKASAKPTPKPTPSAKSLPPGAYHARITWKQGLILRGEPKQEAERIGGVGFNSKVIVLQESQDKAWQKIRAEGDEKEAGKQEGWVKAGNTQKVDENDSQQKEKPEKTEKQQ